jgi:hypothetical protein
VTGPGGGGTQPPVTGGVTEEQVQSMIDASLQPLQAKVDELSQQVAALEDRMSGPFRAHGPVNLPIVLQNMTSLRAMGDIDVDIMPGDALEPNMDKDENAGAKWLVILRRLLKDDEEEAPAKSKTKK